RVAGVVADRAELVTWLSARAAELRARDAEPVAPGVRLFLTLSGDGDVPDGWPQDGPVDRAALPDGVPARRLAWQCTLHARLTALGLRPDGLLSSGTGHYAARLVRGEQSPA